MAVFATMKSEAASGALFVALGATLARVAAAFVLAMAAGSAIGYAMGRNALVDRVADPWIIVLLNLPALVIIVLAYIWAGLNEAAAIGAVALNKLPIRSSPYARACARSTPGSTRWRASSAFRE